MASKDESYEVTGKVCPPKLPMDNVNMDNWLIIPSSLMESIFTEIPIEGTKISCSTSLCALSSQANVVLSSNGLSHSSVSLPYYFCNFCDHHTDNKAALLRHMSSKHVFKCLFCDFISFTRCGLIQHQLFKHVDAEEMQPILTTKTIQLNTFQLQRHFRYLIQFKDSSSNHSRLGTEPDDLVNSSHLNTLSGSEDGENYFLSLEKAGNYMQKEVSDSVTISKPISSAHKESLSFNSVSRILGEENDRIKSIVIDSHFNENEVSDELKTLNKNEAEISNIKKASDMPHFLDESDSSVTSSSNHRSNFSPPALQKSKIRGLQSVHETKSPINDQVASFLTDPLSASKIVGKVNKKQDGSDSNHNIVKKILKFCSDENTSEHCGKESEFTLNSNSDKACTEIHTPTSEYVCRNAVLRSPKIVLNNMTFEEREGSLSPNLSSLSVERLQKQLEEAVSNSPGFTFLESLKSSHPLSNNLSVAAESNMSSASVSSHLLIGIKQGFRCFNDDSECVKKDMDNFLLTTEDHHDSERLEQGDNQLKKEPAGNLEYKVQSTTPTKQKKSENYDLLRNLLVQKPKETTKHLFNNPKGLITIPLCRNTPGVALPREKNSSNLINLRTRASDMSLKDLLIGNHPQVNSAQSAKPNKDIDHSQNINIFLVCGYCNFESANKVQFDAHVISCKQMNHDTKDCDSPQEHADMIYECVKQEPLENSCVQASTFSSGEFSASGLLKSLTAHSTIKQFKSPFISEPQKSCDVFKGVTTKHEIKQQTHEFNSKIALSMFHQEVRENKDLSANTSDNINIHSLGVLKSTSLNLTPNVHNFDTESNINKGADPVTRKRKCRHDEDLDYVYESENSSDTDSTSECEHKIKSVPSYKKKARKNVKNICEHGKSLHMVKHTLQNPQVKQSKINLACFRCSYSTENKADMRQHLMLNHPHSIPFVQAVFENKKEGLIYFCCGLNSSCTFFSMEGVEIFKHIKLCYFGLLDNFLDVSSVEYVDYSQALVSLGIAAKQLDPSPTTYYCLRCNFSETKFQPISYHVATNHSKNVAGVLLVNRILEDTQVRMVCLSCNAHVTSKEWSVHRCRILDAETCKGCISAPFNTSVTTPTTKISPPEHNTSASLEANYDQGKVSLLCELMAAEKGKIVQNSKKQSFESSLLNSKITELELEMGCNSQGKSSPVKGLNIKEEILECEDNFDVPVHFEHSVDTNLDNEANNSGIQLENPENTEVPFKHYANKGTSHSSVLQNLLTAPKVSDFNMRSFSLLQNLLKSPQIDKEQQLSHLAIGSDVTSTLVATPQSKYSAILESLSRQVSTSHQTSPSTIGNILTASSDKSQLNSKSLVTDVMKCSSSNDLSNSQGQRLWKNEINMKEEMFSFPDHFQMLPSIISDGSTSVPLSQLSPRIIPKPPVLPLIPPLSPPPSMDGTLHVDNQNTHAPFSNLLRGLLSKISSKVSTHNPD